MYVTMWPNRCSRRKSVDRYPMCCPLTQVFALLDTHGNTSDATVAARSGHPGIALLLLGIRVSELVALDMQDVDLHSGHPAGAGERPPRASGVLWQDRGHKRCEPIWRCVRQRRRDRKHQRSSVNLPWRSSEHTRCAAPCQKTLPAHRTTSSYQSAHDAACLCHASVG